MSHDHIHAAHHPHHAELTEILDLDAEILAPVMRSVHDDIGRAADSPVRSIIDLGAGTGTGTFGLLRHFAQSRAIAVDASDEMLTHLARQAAHLGLADRVTTIRADLDVDVPDIEPADLVWASASLHHLADPDRTLGQITRTIRPGGLLAVVELEGHPRFVPDEAPGGSAELRAHQLLATDRAVDMPTMGSDWGARLERAGLAIQHQRVITVELAAPLPDSAGGYAAAVLTRIGGAVVERLEPADREAFASLVDGGPDDVRHRADLRVSTRRSLWIARRAD